MPKPPRAQLELGPQKRIVTHEQSRHRALLLERMVMEGWPWHRVTDEMRKNFGMAEGAVTKLAKAIYVGWERSGVNAMGPATHRSRELRMVDDAIRKVLYNSEGKARVTDEMVKGKDKAGKDVLLRNDDRLDMNSFIRLLVHKSDISGSREAAKEAQGEEFEPEVDAGGPELVGAEE